MGNVGLFSPPHQFEHDRWYDEGGENYCYGPSPDVGCDSGLGGLEGQKGIHGCDCPAERCSKQHRGPEYLEVLPSSGEPLVIFLPYSVAGIIAAGRYERSHRQRKEQTSEHWLRFKNSPPTNDGQRTNPQPNRCPATTRHSHFPLWWLIGPRFGGSPLMCHGRKALEHRTPRLGSSVRPRGIMVDPTS